MDRRVFFGTLAAAVLAGAGALTAGAVVGDRFYSPSAAAVPSPTPTPTVPPRPVPVSIASPLPLPPHFFDPKLTKIPAPHSTLTGLPGKGNLVSLTVDDGVNSEVVGLYAQFAQKTGMRITFFPNGINSSWTDNAAALKPLVESGQVQLGNHTWSHPNLQKLTDAGIVQELSRNDDFLRNIYGNTIKPFFRPPFGFHDRRVDAAAASIGYTTPVLWYGSLSDSGLITEDQLKAFATQWMLPQHIVIGHANFMTVTNCFDFLVELIRSRSLVPVTLNDVFSV